MLKKSLVSAVILALLGPHLAFGDNNYLTGVTVNKLRTYQNSQFGGCVFGLSLNVNTEGGNPGGITCEKDRLVTADCAGRVRSKSDGLAMWEIAQIAFVTGKKIDINVTDDASLVSGDGYCVARSVFLSNAE